MQTNIMLLHPRLPAMRVNHNQNVIALRQRKAETITKANAVVSAATAAGRDMTEAETTELNGLLASAEGTQKQLEAVEKLLDLERASPNAALPPSQSRTEITDNTAKRPWTSLGEQMAAIAKYERSGRQSTSADSRLFAALGSNETVESEGGFLVHPEYSTDLLKRTYDVGILTSMCRQLPMSSTRLVLNAVDEDSRVDGSRWGGIQAFWQNEAAAYTASKPKFREMQLTANKLTGLMYATEEMLADQSMLQGYANEAFPDEFAFKIDDALVNGLGAGQPLGFLNSGAVVSIGAEAAQPTATIVTANILKMGARLPPRSEKTAVWLANVDTKPQLRQLTLGSGTAVTLLYLPPRTGTNNSDNAILDGKPVIFIEQAATLGTSGDLMLVDLQQYLLANKTGGIRADSSMHVAFLTGEMAFRFMMRLDGQPWWKKPLTPKNGSNTLSPFITLATRP